jgi:hypothetical protein
MMCERKEKSREKFQLQENEEKKNSKKKKKKGSKSVIYCLG